MLALAFALTLIAGTPRLLPAQNGGAAIDSGLQPGDVVVITVWQRDELSGEFTVAPDGSLNHPLYRQVRVSGVAVDQIGDRLRSFLGQYEANPQVVVQPLYKVSVAGHVMRPDIYSLPPGTTVSQAVTHAGGVTESGKRDHVLLVRNARETRLDLAEADAIRTQVQSGDQILVKGEGTGGFRRTVLPLIQISFTIANLIYNLTN